MLKDKNILLCVSGGIAAYKAIDLASKLMKEKANVKTILTENAKKFVSPINFSTITHNKVSYDTFDENEPLDHINFASWADLIVVAPATANVIGKIANGIADDLLSTTIMASRCPILIVPAMNVFMYENKAMQRNLKQIQDYGYFVMEPEIGMLACGYAGKGKFPETSEIVYFIKTYTHYSKDLKGKRILITAGASQEKIDPMRFITNHSSGKMGMNLARAAFQRGADVTLIYAGITQPVPKYLKSIKAISAKEMYNETIKISQDFDVIIKSAAVADYTIQKPSEQKIKKSGNLNLELVRTNDILKKLGEIKTENQILIGFAAESQNLIENAKQKLLKKSIDYIVANNINVSSKDDTEVTIISSKMTKNLKGSKFFIAHKILDEINVR